MPGCAETANSQRSKLATIGSKRIFAAPIAGSANIEPGEVYRLDDADLAFGELLPQKPGAMEQEEYEERTGVNFQLKRLADGVGRLAPATHALAIDRQRGDE